MNPEQPQQPPQYYTAPQSAPQPAPQKQGNKAVVVLLSAILACIVVGFVGFGIYYFTNKSAEEKAAMQHRQDSLVSAVNAATAQAAQATQNAAQATAQAQRATAAAAQSKMLNYSSGQLPPSGGFDAFLVLDADGYTNIRSTPSTSGKIVGRVKSGSYVRVSRTDWRGNWAKVYDPNYNFIGYIHGSRLH